MTAFVLSNLVDDCVISTLEQTQNYRNMIYRPHHSYYRHLNHWYLEIPNLFLSYCFFDRCYWWLIACTIKFSKEYCSVIGICVYWILFHIPAEHFPVAESMHNEHHSMEFREDSKYQVGRHDLSYSYLRKPTGDRK